MSDIGPLGKIKDWFHRVEYQQRGSPHIHMLIWLENAPVFGVDKDEEVIAFIDQIITCSKPDNDPKLLELVNRQMHRHSHTCRKKSKNVCRFNYPQPPMKSTQILYPLDDDTSETVIRSKTGLWKDIKNKLNVLKESEDITFDQRIAVVSPTVISPTSRVDSPTSAHVLMSVRQRHIVHIRHGHINLSNFKACRK